MEDLTKITPNREKAESILKMVEKTIAMVEQIDRKEFPSNVTKEYYEIIRELMSVILLLDGWKADGEGAHKKQIEYLEGNYKEFDKSEILLVDDLRITRNKIAYDGFFVKERYIERKLNNIKRLIQKLKRLIEKKLTEF